MCMQGSIFEIIDLSDLCSKLHIWIWLALIPSAVDKQDLDVELFWLALGNIVYPNVFLSISDSYFFSSSTSLDRGVLSENTLSRGGVMGGLSDPQ